jgi:hypothetical protein
VRNTPHHHLDRPGRGRRLLAALAAVGMTAGGLTLASVTPAHAAIACGLNELDQNIFLVNDGFWHQAGNWSRNHIPAGGEAVCVPGGIVARVSSATSGLLGAAGGNVTTLRVEGTVRIESGTTVGLATAIYGGSNLINGGVIQVLGNSTFDMNSDQNGAPAFQNAVGGSLIQVQSGSTVLLRRGFVNAGTINLTGGGNLILDSASSGYTTTNDGSIIGGKLRMRAGNVNYQGNGSLSVLASGGLVRGVIGSAQTLEVICETSSSVVDFTQGLVNNGTIRFLPPPAGECNVSTTLPGGQTLTNNGAITFGTAGQAGPPFRFSSNFYNRGGTLLNSPSGVITINDLWLNDDNLTNQGTITIAQGGRLEQRSWPLVNSGTVVNRGVCELYELQQSGTLELVTDCNVRRSATFTSGSTLRSNWTAAALAKLTVGLASSLAGTVDVITSGTPPAADTVRNLVTGPVTGTFSSVTSQSATVGYTAQYPNASTVQLRSGAPTGSGAIMAIVPGRLLDTRPGESTIEGAGAGAGLQPAGATIEVQVTGRNGVPSNATAAVLNVTVTQTQGPGFATVYPCGSPRPTASNLNFGAGATVPNGVIAKIGAGGKVCIFVSNATHVIADVTGYYTSASPYTPLVPARLLDTRPGETTVDGLAQGGGFVTAGGTVELQVGGRGGVPTNAAAAALNVTVTQTQGLGFATVYPCGSPRPTASNLNFGQTSTVPNNVIAKLGTAGKVCIFVSNGAHVVADVSGYFTVSSAFQPITPARLLDSRPGESTVDGLGLGAGPAGAGTVVEVQVTVTQPGGAGFVTAYPCGSPRPTASSLNFDAGATVPNGLISKVGTGGKVCLFASNGTHLIADLNAWFA